MASLANPNGTRVDHGAHPCWPPSRSAPRARGRSKAPDDRQQDSGCEKAIGKRDATPRCRAELRRAELCASSSAKRGSEVVGLKEQVNLDGLELSS